MGWQQGGRVHFDIPPHSLVVPIMCRSLFSFHTLNEERVSAHDSTLGLTPASGGSAWDDRQLTWPCRPLLCGRLSSNVFTLDNTVVVNRHPIYQSKQFLFLFFWIFLIKIGISCANVERIFGRSSISIIFFLSLSFSFRQLLLLSSSRRVDSNTEGKKDAVGSCTMERKKKNKKWWCRRRRLANQTDSSCCRPQTQLEPK